MTSNLLLRIAGRVGCSLSVACAVHCLAMPVFVTLMSTVQVAEELELPAIVLSLVIAAVTFSAGFVRNGTALPLSLLLIAGPLMIASHSVNWPWLETTMLVCGAGLLCIGHVVNLRRGHDCALHD